MMATFNKRLELSFMPNDAGRRLHYCAFDTGRTETMCGTNAIYIVIEDVNVHDHIQLVLLSEQIIEQPGVSHSWYSTLKELSSQHSKPFYCRVTSTDRQAQNQRSFPDDLGTTHVGWRSRAAKKNSVSSANPSPASQCSQIQRALSHRP